LAGHTHRGCANCPEWAVAWYERAVRRARTQQPTLWETPAWPRPARRALPGAGRQRAVHHGAKRAGSGFRRVVVGNPLV